MEWHKLVKVHDCCVLRNGIPDRNLKYIENFKTISIDHFENQFLAIQNVKRKPEKHM